MHAIQVLLALFDTLTMPIPKATVIGGVGRHHGHVVPNSGQPSGQLTSDLFSPAQARPVQRRHIQNAQTVTAPESDVEVILAEGRMPVKTNGVPGANTRRRRRSWGWHNPICYFMMRGKNTCRSWLTTLTCTRTVIGLFTTLTPLPVP